MTALKDRLIQLRNEKKLMQKEAAELIGLSIPGYQRYEYGTRNPTSDVLIKIADFYNVSLDYLVGRSDDPKRY